MNQPKVAAKVPVRIELEEGKKYAWCSCGESSNQPFCDGAHKGTGFSPIMFKVEESKTASVCQCKQSDSPIFCDGSHRKL